MAERIFPLRMRDGVWALLDLVLAVVSAAALCSLVLVVAGYPPGTALSAFVRGALGNRFLIGETLMAATPLTAAGLSFVLAFRVGLFNLGIEGQLVLGGLVAAWAGFGLTGLPHTAHVIIAIALGAATGALWAAIPGYLKAVRGAHEVIVTIMFNYIGFKIASALVAPGAPLKGPGDLPGTPSVEATARLSRLLAGTRLTGGIFVILGLCLVVWWLLKYTRLGYKMRAVGLSPGAAEYSGIPVASVTIAAMALSGGVAGSAGAIEVLGLHGKYFDGFSPGYGFDAIAVALMGQASPGGVVLAGLLFGALKVGAMKVQQELGVSRDMIRVLQATILLFMVANMSLRAWWENRRRGSREV